jgi:hypothetical protein
LTSQRDGDQPSLQRGLRAWLGREHEPAVVLAVVLAVAEGAQLDLLRGQTRQVNVPPGAARGYGPVWLQARRVAEQGSVLDAYSVQIQQAGELLPDSRL